MKYFNLVKDDHSVDVRRVVLLVYIFDSYSTVYIKNQYLTLLHPFQPSVAFLYPVKTFSAGIEMFSAGIEKQYQAVMG